MRVRLIVVSIIVLLVVAACNLGTTDSNETPTVSPLATATDIAPPGVVVLSPANGSEVVNNQPVLVEVSTTGNAESVELFVNNTSVQEVRISDPSSSTNRSVLNFTPRETGTAVLRVRAYRGNVSGDSTNVNLTVRQSQSFVTATSQGPIIDPNDPTCRALVNTGLNFRKFPTVDAEVIRVLAAGEVLPIVGRLADNTWVQLRSNVTIGWVSSSFVTRYGNCSGLVIVNPPATAAPTNTPQPTFTPIIVTATLVPTSTPLPKPNLIVASISGPEDVTIPTGESEVTVKYNVVVRNQGGALNEQFQISGRILPSGTTFDFGVVGSLGVNQNINIEGDVTFTQAGSFAVQFIVDSDNVIDEMFENDNAGFIDVIVVQE